MSAEVSSIQRATWMLRAVIVRRSGRIGKLVVPAVAYLLLPLVYDPPRAQVHWHPQVF